MTDSNRRIRFTSCMLLSVLFMPLLAVAQAVGQGPLPCGDGGTLMRLSGDNNFSKNLLNLQSFAKAHATLTAKEPAWVKDLTQPGEAMRVYQQPGQKPVRLYWQCDANNCSINFSYGAIEGNLEKYGILISENADFRTVGELSSNAQRAIACAAKFERLSVESGLPNLKSQAPAAKTPQNR